MIVGNSGADILVGGGGMDHLYGDAGDDRIEISDGLFARINGGAGSDNLAFHGSLG